MGIPAAIPAYVQMTYGISSVQMHSGFPMERVEQMIMTLLDDVTMIAHAIWGGKYIRRAHLGLWGCHLGFWY